MEQNSSSKNLFEQSSFQDISKKEKNNDFERMMRNFLQENSKKICVLEDKMKECEEEIGKIKKFIQEKRE